jgi:predicted transporter
MNQVVVLNFLGLILIPTILTVLGIYFSRKYSKSKKDVFWGALIMGFGAGWLVVGIAIFLSSQ